MIEAREEGQVQLIFSSCHWSSRAFRVYLRCLLPCLMMTVPLGCGASSSTRNYTKIVEVEGRTVLEITCEYVGKQPGAPSSYISSHDYQSTDTDFYRLTIVNLTDTDVVIERVAYRMKTGPTKGLQFASAESIQKTWGTNIVPANSSISRANNLVWSKSKRNTLLKTYTFRIGGSDSSHELVDSEIALVYKR